MATRSAIGIITDHYIYGIYCHWDGYPDNNGRILIDNYKTVDQVWALIKLGDLSSLGKKLGDKHKEHDDGKSCTYYDRDYERGPHPYKSFQNRREFKVQFEHMGCEYFYLFKDNQWLMSSSDSDWAPVETWLLTAE